MSTSLSREHRNLLESVTKEARVKAESACEAALENLAVHETDYRSHMSMEQRALRNRLRARGRAIGDMRDKRTGIQDIRHLKELAAYEHWHRLLFTRFLMENHLLITDGENGNVPVTLEECEELAPVLNARDGLDLACRFASRTLPGVFRRDDPVLDLPMALNDQVELRKLLAMLPAEVFVADDALGWTYQFWQEKRKAEVNNSGRKIGADELSPVTQLFTEDYMVDFLLHNTLGAWWAGKIGLIKAETEEDARAKVALAERLGIPGISWTFLRLVQDETNQTWRPAAGTFDGWPKTANLIRVLDPCMGSGHFLVSAVPLLVRLRMEEEDLDPQSAVVAVLRDNIHGLELDERCTQIAAFNVVMGAWKIAGYQVLPSPNLACAGLAPSSTEEEWSELAGNNEHIREGIERLHKLFKSAPILGSLINPRAKNSNLIEAQFHDLASLLATALALKEAKRKLNTDATELGIIAQGLTKAAELLSSQFTLVVTNVPYLGRDRQDESLKDFCECNFAEAKADLATCFIERCLDFCVQDCSTALVTPQSWLYQDTFKRYRPTLLKAAGFILLGRLGPGAFDGISGEVVNVCLITLNKRQSNDSAALVGVDVSELVSVRDKRQGLQTQPLVSVVQHTLLKNPQAKISLETLGERKLLSHYATSHLGICTGDYSRFGRVFWEIGKLGSDWVPQHTTVDNTCYYGGMQWVLFWEGGDGAFVDFLKDRLGETGIYQWLRGQEAWRNVGIIISATGSLQASLYLGDSFDNNVTVIIPRERDHLEAVWTFCESRDFHDSVRRINQALKITDQSMVQVPFDLPHWQKVASEKYPSGLPKPHSDDPTQWLFNGYPTGSTQPLHVAVARMLGYRWPRQTGSSFSDCPNVGPDGLESFADEDGIVCLPPVNREGPAASRLRQLLTAALGAFNERALIAAAGLKGSKSKTLEDWLRDEFFEQHGKIFLDRPFIWHVWDGRQDGFHALVNYHALDNATLKKLTYSYLGDWIRQQDEDAKADKPGAAERLGSARALQTKLGAILKGEAPVDIFVRWKSLKEQGLGWQPDLNDGIRQNIRPFLLVGDVAKKGAGVFRTIPLKLKDKDRGIEPTRPKDEYPWFWCEQEPGTDPGGGAEFVGNRWNNCHLTLATKEAARKR
jgi:hypothetical protein